MYHCRGNIHSYTYAEEGASLYDVLNLFNGKQSAVHDPVIKGMRDLAELEEYISMTGEIELALMVEIVKKYGNGIPGILRSLKDKHVGDQEKERAEYIFSTVHRAKGMEYDEVHLAEDFMTEERLMAPPCKSACRIRAPGSAPGSLSTCSRRFTPARPMASAWACR